MHACVTGVSWIVSITTRYLATVWHYLVLLFLLVCCIIFTITDMVSLCNYEDLLKIEKIEIGFWWIAITEVNGIIGVWLASEGLVLYQWQTGRQTQSDVATGARWEHYSMEEKLVLPFTVLHQHTERHTNISTCWFAPSHVPPSWDQSKQ